MIVIWNLLDFILKSKFSSSKYVLVKNNKIMKIKEREEKVANTMLGLSRLQFLKNKLLTSTTIAKLVQISKETKFKILFHKNYVLVVEEQKMNRDTLTFY